MKTIDSSSFLGRPVSVKWWLVLCSAGRIQLSERTKQHLDEFAHDQFIVELRQPKVISAAIIILILIYC